MSISGSFNKSKIFFLLTISGLFLVNQDLLSQFKKGDIELSFSGNLGTSTLSRTSIPTGSIRTDLDFIQINLSPGYFLTDNILISGDLCFFETNSDHHKEIINENYFIFNFSYIYKIPKKDLGIFIKLGYGFSNTPMYNKAGYIIQRLYEKAAAGILNIGTGLKMFFNENTAFTAEINFKNIYWDIKKADNSTVGYNNTKTSLLLGFSIII